MLQGFLNRLDKLEVITSASLNGLLEVLCQEEKQIETTAFRAFLDALEEGPTDQQLSSLVNALSLSSNEDGASIKELHSLLLDYQKEMHEIVRLEHELQSKEFQLNLQEQQDTFQEMRDQGCFSEAAWGLISIQRMIQDYTSSLEEQDMSIPEQDRLLIEGISSLDKNMKVALTDFFENRFSVNPEYRTLRIRSSPEGNLFSEMWKAAEILNQTDIVLPRLAERITALIDDVILGEEMHNRQLSASIEEEPDEIIFIWKEEPCQTPIEAVEGRTKTLIQLLEFLCRILLCSMHSLSEGLGNRLWPNLQPVLAFKVLDIGDRLEENQRLLYLEATFKEAISLETKLKTINFLTENNCDFSLAISAASKAAFHKYSEHYVVDARDAMISPIWDTITVGKHHVLDLKSIHQQMTRPTSETISSHGLDLLRSPIGRGVYQITETASRIQQIIEAIATEGCSKGTLVMQSLLQGIRDICFMYSSMFPKLHSKELEVPHLGLLTANDCFYLCDEMLLLPFTVPNFRSMSPNVRFMDEAQRLDQTGKRILDHQVAVQSSAFKEVLTGVDDFGSLKTGQQGIALRKATNQIIRMLNQLGRVMHEVLSVSDRCSVAVSITEAIAKPILTKLMSRTDISEQESRELPGVVHGLIEEIPPSMLSISKEICKRDITSHQAAIDIDDDQTAEQWLLYKRFSDGCLNLRKLGRLLRMWDAKMNQIVDWWRKGELMDDGFTAEDVRNLIWALFEHSEKREDAIAIVTGIA